MIGLVSYLLYRLSVGSILLISLESTDIFLAIDTLLVDI